MRFALSSSRLALCAGALVLSGGLALAVLGTRPPPEPKFKGKLIDLLPTEKDLPGWTVTHLPIAETPEMQAQVDELLNFDQGEFVSYSKGDMRIAVYIAHWRPGKMEVRSISRHTPDVCWVKAGWKQTKREEIPVLPAGDREVGFTEHREFHSGAGKQHVVFWHIVDGEIVSFRTGGRPPWHATILEFLRWGSAVKQEQFFLRISSEAPLENFWSEDLVQRVVRSVPGLATSKS